MTEEEDDGDGLDELEEKEAIKRRSEGNYEHSFVLVNWFRTKIIFFLDFWL